MRKKKKGRNPLQSKKWDEVEKKILSILPAGPISANELAQQLGVKRQTIYKHLWEHRERGAVIQAGGKWIWQEERWITRKELRNAPEILSLKRACERGSFRYDIRRLDYFAPKQTGVSRPYSREDQGRGREIGAVYVNVDSQTSTVPEEGAWKITSAGRDYFLEKSPYFLAEALSYAVSSDTFNDLNIDIDYFTGEKDPRKLTDDEITKLMGMVWGGVDVFQTIYSINPPALTKWLVTQSGREALARAIANPIVTNPSQRKKQRWGMGEALTKRLGGRTQ